MSAIQTRAAVILGVALACSVGMLAAAQDTGKAKDDTLDALLKDLGQTGDGSSAGTEKAASSGKAAGAESKGSPRSQNGSKKKPPSPTSNLTTSAGGTQNPSQNRSGPSQTKSPNDRSACSQARAAPESP